MTRKTHKVYVNGKVHVRRRQCKSCIFGPNSPVGKQRVDEMVRKATLDDMGCIPCHSHLYEGNDVEPICRGFFDRFPTRPIRMARSLGVIGWVTDQ